MRARYPDREGYVDSRGVRISWEQHGEGEPDILAHAIADGLKRPVLCRDVETDGARRAAALIARLL